MDLYRTAETWTCVPGTIAPADGNADRRANYETRNSFAECGPNFDFRVSGFDGTAQQNAESAGPMDLGPNNQRLEDAKPELVHALRELVRQFRQEGVVARRRDHAHHPAGLAKFGEGRGEGEAALKGDRQLAAS
jgi:hypothetical protein